MTVILKTIKDTGYEGHWLYILLASTYTPREDGHVKASVPQVPRDLLDIFFSPIKEKVLLGADLGSIFPSTKTSKKQFADFNQVHLVVIFISFLNTPFFPM